MNNIKLEKKGLIEKVKRNRDAHIEAYRLAMQGFRTEVLGEIDRIRRLVEEGAPDFPMVLTTERPTSHQKEYDRAIAILEMDVEEIAEINEREFSQYVLDDWAWKADFLNVSAKYLR